MSDAKYGTDHPEIIDFISQKDGVCYLYVVQSAELDDERTLALQQKLNNYLAFILDGQLEREYPELAALSKCVHVELEFPPEGIADEFLQRVAPVFKSEGIEFQYGVFEAS